MTTMSFMGCFLGAKLELTPFRVTSVSKEISWVPVTANFPAAHADWAVGR